MLVLEGGQGSIKSTACRILAGAELLLGLRCATSPRRTPAQHLRGLWLVEIAELEAMCKAESSAMKSLPHARAPRRYRPPYGRSDRRGHPTPCSYYVAAPRSAMILSATRQALAMMVKVGLAPVPVGKGEPSTA